MRGPYLAAGAVNAASRTVSSGRAFVAGSAGALCAAGCPHLPVVGKCRVLLKSDQAVRFCCGAGAPRSKPSVLRSSSMSGQWMPYPPPATFQLRRCSVVAWNNRGYQVSGTEMVRPSFRRTLSESSSKDTHATLSSAAIIGKITSGAKERLLKKSAEDAPRGLKSARRIENNDLSARLKSCPDTKPSRSEFFGSPQRPVVLSHFPARLKRLREESKKQIPRGLKSARDDKNKGLLGTTKAVP